MIIKARPTANQPDPFNALPHLLVMCKGVELCPQWRIITLTLKSIFYQLPALQIGTFLGVRIISEPKWTLNTQ